MTHDNDNKSPTYTEKLENRVRELEYLLDSEERLFKPLQNTFFYNILKERGKKD